MTPPKIPKNTDVDFLCNLAIAAWAQDQAFAAMAGKKPVLAGDNEKIAALRKSLKSSLTAYRKTLKPRRRT